MAVLNSSYDYRGTVTSNAFSYDTGNAKLSIMDDITLLSHRETELLYMLMSDEPLTTIEPIWQTVALSGINKGDHRPEGADYTFTTPAKIPTRVRNVTCIWYEDVRVTGSAQEDAHYNVESEIAFQLELKEMELLRRMQYDLINDQISNTTEDAARSMRGIKQWFTLNSNSADLSTQEFDEAYFKRTFLKGAYADNFKITDVWATDIQMERLLGFAGGIQLPSGQNPVGQFDTKDKTRYDRIEDIVTNFGTHKLHQIWADDGTATPNGYLLDSEILGMDMRSDLWSFRWLQNRSPWMEETPKTGDRWSAVIQAEGTLIARAGGFAGWYTFGAKTAF